MPRQTIPARRRPALTAPPLPHPSWRGALPAQAPAAPASAREFWERLGL
ncbi:MAG TPA: hypothetical protein VFF98_09535 [Novosphingobium sp.]|nr:hypothetical protein [Novosphingobium sp.]